MQIKFVLLVVFQFVASNEAYNVSCPPQSHWELRAKSMCIPPRNYTCLYNVTFRVNVYRDRCSRPRILAAGYKYVFQPNLNRAACSFIRYQPFIFDTIGRSDCTFLKSFCNSEGQMTSTNGTTRSDRTCLCNINEGYTFVTETNNQCSCNPSNEDCSCYIDNNHNNRTIGSRDSKCYGEITRNPSPSLRDTLNKSHIVKIKAFDNYKYNLVLPKEKYSTTAALYILILVLSYHLVTVGLYISKRIVWHLISILPKASMRLQERDKIRYNNLMQSSKNEKIYFSRVMIVRRNSAGKTCLLGRLLKESIDNVSSKDGIDIVVRRCKINIVNGKWTIEKDIDYDKVDQIKRAAIPIERRNSVSVENNVNPPLLKTNTPVETKTSDDGKEERKSDETSRDTNEALEENACNCKFIQPCVYM